MRNKIIILIFSLFSVTLSAQFVGDTLPSLPYSEVYSNNFNLNISGWSNFNGGLTSNSNGKLIITNGASPSLSRGGYLTSEFSLKPSTDYKIEMYVDSVNSDGFRVFSQWATQVYTGQGEGWHTIKFTSPAAPGGFGSRPVVTTNTTTAARVEIGYFRLSELNDHADIPSVDQVKPIAFGSQSIFYRDIFTEADRPFIGFNGVAGTTISFSDGNAVISATATTHRYTFGRDLFPDTCAFDVFIDIDVSQPVILRPVWGDATQDYIISQSGKYKIRFKRDLTGVTSQLNGLVVVNAQSGANTITVKELSIMTLPDNIFSYEKDVVLGSGTILGEPGTVGQASNRPSVVIGQGASTTNNDAIVIGADARAGGFQMFGAQSGANGEMVTVGGIAGGWRTASFGSESAALGQSSVAIGAGAEALTTHGVAIGRGSYLGQYPNNVPITQVLTGNTVTFEARKIFMNNGWAHSYPKELSDQTRGATVVPATLSAEYRGMDAFDSRWPNWSAGTAMTNYFYFKVGTDSVFYANKDNVTTAPTLSSPDWNFWRIDTNGPASDFNVSAGNAALFAGLATGTGVSGKAQFVVGVGNNGVNTKDTQLVAGEFRSAEAQTTGTYLYLYDSSTSTLKRVVNRAKNASAGTNKIISFGGLKFE